MRHNKYICENPVSVSVDGDTYTFTLLDCRHTSPPVIKHVLNDFAKSYLRDMELYDAAPKTPSGNLLLTTAGKVATIVITGSFDPSAPTLSLSDPTQSFDFEARNYSFSVSSNTDWSWSTDVDWIISEEETEQSGSHQFAYEVLENPTSDRTGTITFTAGGITVTHVVTQLEAPTLSLSDADQSFGFSGGSHTFDVISNTTWVWFCDAEWVTSDEQPSQTNNREFTYSVSENTGNERTAVINFFDSLGGTVTASHQITQALAPLLSISDPSEGFDSSSGTHTFQVNSNTTWSWSSNVAWITSGEAASQTGNQEFTYAVSENTEGSERSGQITFTNGVVSVTHTVTQAAEIAPPQATLVLTDPTHSFPSTTGSHTFSVNASGTWSWSSDSPWVISVEAVSQSGNQDFTYSVSENDTGSDRTAQITFVSGPLSVSHEVSQAAPVAPPADPDVDDFEEFDYVADMLASTDPAKGAGEIWYAQGYRYVELDPAATNQHLTTAAGVKLRALQDGSGAVTTEQLGWLPEVAQESAFNDHLPKLDPVSVLTVTDFYNCDGGRASLSQPSMNIFGAYRRYSGFGYGTQGGNARIRLRSGGGSVRRIKYSCDQSATASSGFGIETPRFVYEDMQGEQKALVNCGFTRADKSHIENCEFWDAHLQMYMLGGFCTRISDCYFTADWGPERLFGEGIKTTTAENGTPSMKMYSNYYDRCKRDGIDLTGGGKGMRICNNVFHLNGIGRDPTHTGVGSQGIDLKTPSNNVEDPTSRLPTEFIDICDNIFWGATSKTTQVLLSEQTAEIFHVYGMKGLMHSRNTYEFKEYGGNIRGGGPPISDLINLNNERLYRTGLKPWYRGSARNIVQTASPEPNRSPLFKLGSPKWVDFANLISLVPTNNLVDPGPGLGGPKITGHSTKFALANTLWTRLHQLDNYIHLTVSMSVYGPGGITLAWANGGTPETSGGRGIVVAGCFGKNVNSVLSYSTGANGLIDDCSVVGNIIKGTTLVNDPRFLTAPNREGLVIIQNTSNGIPARVGDANIDPVIEQNVGVI